MTKKKENQVVEHHIYSHIGHFIVHSFSSNLSLQIFWRVRKMTYHYINNWNLENAICLLKKKKACFKWFHNKLNYLTKTFKSKSNTYIRNNRNNFLVKVIYLFSSKLESKEIYKYSHTYIQIPRQHRKYWYLFHLLFSFIIFYFKIVE